jgi:hypothetical protein
MSLFGGRQIPYVQSLVITETLEIVREILQLVRHQMSALEDLKAEVAAVKTTEESAITLINGIAQQLRDALAANAGAGGGISEADATQIIMGLEADRAGLAKAVTDNTSGTPAVTAPAAPAETPAPATDTPPAS